LTDAWETCTVPGESSSEPGLPRNQSGQLPDLTHWLLAKMLRDPDRRIRVWAIRNIASPQYSTPALEKSLGDPETHQNADTSREERPAAENAASTPRVLRR